MNQKIISLLDIDISPEAQATIGDSMLAVAEKLGLAPEEVVESMTGEIIWNIDLGHIMFVLEMDQGIAYIEIPKGHWRFRSMCDTTQ